MTMCKKAHGTRMWVATVLALVFVAGAETRPGDKFSKEAAATAEKRKELIKAEIAGVGETTRRPSVCDWEFIDHAVTVDAGRDKGVFKGMKLHVMQPKVNVQWVTITEVGGKASQAVMTRCGDDHRTPSPKVGWELSTNSGIYKESRE